MGALGAALGAVLVAVWVVLRDVGSYDRPVRPAPALPPVERVEPVKPVKAARPPSSGRRGRTATVAALALVMAALVALAAYQRRYALTASLAVTLGAAWLVLRGIDAHEHPASPRAVAPVRPDVVVVPAADTSMLEAFARVEADAGPRVSRRLGAAAVLLALTLITATLVGVAIYQGLGSLKSR